MAPYPNVRLMLYSSSAGRRGGKSGRTAGDRRCLRSPALPPLNSPMNRRPSMKRCVLLAALLAASCHDVREDYDLVLRGGTIVDGTGAPGVPGDIAVRGDRIGAVAGRGAAEIDARGLVVALGFIDMHSHSDYLLLEDGAAQSKIRQGVTTEVLGEESSGGPSKGKLKPRRASGDEEGHGEWTTLGGYFAALERSKTSVNVASYVGQGNVWRCVMGDSYDRPTPAQLAEMRALVAEAMEDGAFG